MFRVLTNHIAFSKCRPCSLYHLRYRATVMAVTLHDLELRMVTRIIGDQAMAADSALLWLTVRPLSAHLDRSRAPGRPSNADVRRPINLSENRCADSKPNREINR